MYNIEREGTEEETGGGGINTQYKYKRLLSLIILGVGRTWGDFQIFSI